MGGAAVFNVKYLEHHLCSNYTGGPYEKQGSETAGRIEEYNLQPKTPYRQGYGTESRRLLIQGAFNFRPLSGVRHFLPPAMR